MSKDINMMVFAPHSFEVVDLRPIGSAALIQTRPSAPGAHGFRNTISLGQGLFASWASVHRAEAVEEHYDSNGNIKINLRIEGNSVISGETHGPNNVTAMMCSALLQPKGRTKYERFEAGTHEISVTISATRDHLTRALGFQADGFEGALRAFLEGNPYEFTLLRSEFSIEMKQAADAFFKSAGDAVSQRLLLQARAHDIIRLFFEWMRSDHSTKARFRPQELELVETVKQLVTDRMHANIATADIATEVGSSPSRLTRLFKAVEGRTIGEYVTARRMARALELMQEGRLSITQVAFELGYEHSANFSTAFRRHFGMTPRQAIQGTGKVLPPPVQ